MNEFSLERNRAGQLVCVLADGSRHEGAVPVRAFPLTAPQQGISLLSAEGHELAWIDTFDQLPTDTRSLIEAELASREFMPEIARIADVSSYATPSTWQVETDRGNTSFVLRGEEDIRRLGGGGLLIADNHGIQYLIRDRKALDRASRKILERFL